MKKVAAFILIVILIWSLAPYAFANTGEFDYQTILGGREGYQYDKFNKSWSYYRAYAKYYNDATVVIGLRTESESGQSNPSLTELYVKVVDKSGNKLYDAESIDFLIGDDLYSYKSIVQLDTSSVVIIAKNGLRLLEAIKNSNVSDVAIRIGVKNLGGLTIDNLDSTEYNDLKEFCKVYLQYNIWDYCVDKETANLYESYCPLTINGELLDKTN